MFVALFATSGCEQELSTIDLLTAYPWVWDNISTTSTNQFIQQTVDNHNAFMAGCIITAYRDGTYSIISPFSDDPSYGSWVLSGEKTLVADGHEMTIVKLTKKELVLDRVDTDPVYGGYTAAIRLKR